jgi:nanoRNase/pAp phosphatase (c-di-AMP/oligoRNAs hydrolase)
MALPELQQAQSIIDRAGSILLVVPEKTSTDAFASMVALWLALQPKKAGRVDEVSPSHVPKTVQFLPGSSQVTMRPQLKPAVIVDIAGPETIGEVRQERLSGGVRLHIMLGEGVAINKDQVETSIRALPYDAAVVCGASDLEQLGTLFTAHADFFYNTPIINIDHRADNEHFGTVNLVDITASSVAEVTYELIMRLTQTINAPIATALYAGIIAGTEAFQKPSTTPSSFKVAAELIEHKADREAVIQHLVKTKPLSLLKLVGRIYARLHFEESVRVFWSILRPVDFQESGATTDDIAEAVRELTNNIADFNVVYLLHEQQQHYTLYVLLGKGLKKRRDEIQTALEAKRENSLLISSLPATTLQEAEAKAAERIRGILP